MCLGADDIPTILDTLDKYNAKGTFFIVGLWAKNIQETAKAYDRGHEIVMDILMHICQKYQRTKLKRKSPMHQVLGNNREHNPIQTSYGEYNSDTIKVANRLNYKTIQGC